MSETDTRPGKNAVDSEVRPSKGGLQTGLKTKADVDTTALLCAAAHGQNEIPWASLTL